MKQPERTRIGRGVPAAGALLALLLASATADAQIGGAIGFRSATGVESNSANSERKGYEARLTYDREFSTRFGWRAELGYTQMQFQRTEAPVRFQVAENGFEILAQGRIEIRDGAFRGVYGAAGPVASFRALCGSSGSFDQNGRVVCDEGDTFLAGYALTTGYRWSTSEQREMSLEVRFLDGVTAAQGGSLLAISVGVRQRTKRRDR